MCGLHQLSMWPRGLAVFSLLLVVGPHLGHVVRGAEEDGHALVHAAAGRVVRGVDVQDALALAAHRRAARRLDDEGHRRRLVQQAQLAVRVLGVAGVGEDAAVQQRAVHVADHGADVARGVLLAGLALALLDGGDVLGELRVPRPPVGLVDRVDGLASGGDLHVGLGQHELAHLLVEGEALAGLAAEGHDELRRGRVEAVAADDQLVPRLHRRRQALVVHDLAVLVEDTAALGLLEDAEDGAGRDVGVDVGRAVQRVEDRHVLAALLEDDLLVPLVVIGTGQVVVACGDGVVLLLRGEHAHLAGELERVLQHGVSDQVELLLLLALHVDRAAAILKASEARHGRAADQVGDGLACALDGRHHADELVQLRLIRVSPGHLEHVPREGDAGVLAHLRKDRLVEVQEQRSPARLLGRHHG
eukprot:scaffold43356_cov54-Phaeocystis_antarctica.AAC.1